MSDPAGALVAKLVMPFKSVLSQRRDYGLAGTCLLSWWINIFNAQQPAAVVCFRLEIARNCGN
jgi:hypothetical protein